MPPDNYPSSNMPKLSRRDLIAMQALKSLMETPRYKTETFSYDISRDQLAEKAFDIADRLDRKLND